MVNRDQVAKLLRLLEDCWRDEEGGAEDIAVQLGQWLRLPWAADTFQEQCFLLFTAAEYIRMSEDNKFLESYRQQLAAMQDGIMNAWSLPRINIFDTEEAIYSSQAGMAYGSLYNSNLFLKREEVNKCLKQMKNYAYDHHTSSGKLVAAKHGEAVKPDLLWLCVPFGLFTPEDLVLVESVKELKEGLFHKDGIPYPYSAAEMALFAWYYAEKADYGSAKWFLGQTGLLEDKDCLAEAILSIVQWKLNAMGAITEVPIQHHPLGNGNRYQPQRDERSPWFPREGEAVTLYVVTWPLKYPYPLWVHVKEEGQKERILEGQYQETEERYQFELGAFSGGAKAAYFFETMQGEEQKQFKSQLYSFEVLHKRSIQKASLLEQSAHRAVVAMDSCYGVIEVTKGQFTMKLQNQQPEHLPAKTENADLAAGSLQEESLQYPGIKVAFPENSLLTLTCGAVHMQIEEIYFYENSEGISETGIRIAAGEQEGFYGFGERYNHINQRGNVVDVYVYNQYKDQGIRTYLPMPYFISSEGYGLYVPDSGYMEFDLCHTDSQSYRIETQMKTFSFYCFLGSPKEVVGQFTALTGKPQMLPEWAFGPWMSSNNWDSQAEVMKQAELTKQYDIPATVLVIEAWSDEATYYIFNDAVYEENQGDCALQYSDFTFPEWGRWPDPKGMVDYLHENGMACILWQIPIIKYINSLHHLQKDKDEQYAIAHGYCVKNKDQTPYRMPEGWFTDSLLFDYTKEEASKWWFDKRDYLVKEVQVDGFKTDGGEFVFGDDLVFADGRTGEEMRNEYPNLYIQQYYQYIKESRNGMVFSRAGFTGAGRMPAHWAGDERSTFDAFRRNLCAGLNAGLSGVPFWGWDLAGFSGEIPSAELYIRGTAMAAFCPIMQYHAESKAEFNQDRTPWNIAERRKEPEVLNSYRYYAKLRMAMMPYTIEQAARSAHTGIPIMRAMFLEYPEDMNCRELFDEYMFGEDLLVAPIVEEGAVSRNVYVPEGGYTNVFYGNSYPESGWYEMKADWTEIIVLRRPHSRWSFQFQEEPFLVELKE